LGHADLDLCYATATGIAELIRTRKVSALEVTRNALARLDEVEPALNTFVHRDDEGALAMAKEADTRLARGGDLPPLLGVPVSVKDLIEVGLQPCGYGSRTMSGYVAPTDAPSVARLRSAGMVILGKTTTSEFGYRGYTSSLVHGVTRNPWDTSRTPGGSTRGTDSRSARRSPTTSRPCWPRRSRS
jgi:Asp-tRNA(Asn)/Glu-tRNA(Gln) amidotransferase A subunit family amidase